MQADDVAVRNATYRLFVEHGVAPSVAEVATAVDSSVDDVRAAWYRLHDAHAIVLQPNAAEIRMLNPFSAIPTPYRVHANGRSWFANCAWDAFGICAALHADGRIETTCAECGEPIECDVRNQQPMNSDLLFHCLVPAAKWWDDIVFT